MLLVKTRFQMTQKPHLDSTKPNKRRFWPFKVAKGFIIGRLDLLQHVCIKVLISHIQ